MNQDNAKIDISVRPLVNELNQYPGIVTFSSCGGHANPLAASQRPAGEFEINFKVFPLLGGWRSLELIANAMAECADYDFLKLTIWSMGGDGALGFELEGVNNADPDSLAKELAKMRQLYSDHVVTG